MKLGRGSSPLFTIGLVLFPEVTQAEACRQRIKDLRAELGMKLHGKAAEFHFTALGHEHRMAFLNAVADYPFRFFTSTIVKKKLSGQAWQKKAYMYQRAGIMTIDQARDSMLEARLWFDATSSRAFDWEFLRVLKKHAGHYEGLPVIAETRRLDSYKDELIQLVDMVCGSVMAEEQAYCRLIRKRQGAKSVIFP